MNPTNISRYELVSFYKEQLKKFTFLGIGKLTENKVVITQDLINATERRLSQLRGQLRDKEIISWKNGLLMKRNTYTSG